MSQVVSGISSNTKRRRPLRGRLVPGDDPKKSRQHSAYSLENIKRALVGFSATESIQVCALASPDYSHWPAFDLFAGYLMLDAVVAGRATAPSALVQIGTAFVVVHRVWTVACCT